jgi:hypothetical protein
VEDLEGVTIHLEHQLLVLQIQAEVAELQETTHLADRLKMEDQVL